MHEGAWQVLQQASGDFGIMASLQQTDNYNRVWARDSAVAALAIFAGKYTTLYPTILRSLQVLQQAASKYGQIPSNVSILPNGNAGAISFGGPVGRTDASFWWVIASVLYIKHQQNEDFKQAVHSGATKIFALAESWEFNGRHLMYVPMSSNWADEYITHGYVLYDQLLRYWALQLAGQYFDNLEWQQKATDIKQAIAKHFLLEEKLENSLYTKAQQQQLHEFDLNSTFIASFTAGDIVQRYDAWSIGLLLMLQIPNASNTKKLAKVLNDAQQEYKYGVPAFWPFITKDDALYASLQLNHNYHFKNEAGHFHNGGIWPVVNGFAIAGLSAAGYTEQAASLLHILHKNLEAATAQAPFSEYFSAYNGKPGGVVNLCFSAAGFLIANAAVNQPSQFIQHIISAGSFVNTSIETRFANIARQILQQIPINEKKVVAIAIAGESGCGKTTLGKALLHALVQQGLQVELLHQDDYFKLPPRQNHEARLQDFNHIGTGEVRMQLLNDHIEAIKKQSSAQITIPLMNWQNDIEERRVVTIKNTRVIIVEGTYTSLLPAVDHRIFINITHTDTRDNRINRNREEVTDFIEQVLQKESMIINPHQALANIILEKDFTLTLQTPSVTA